jgi:hypothetical protein
MDETQVNPTTTEDTTVATPVVETDEVVVAPEVIEGEVGADATEEVTA